MRAKSLSRWDKMGSSSGKWLTWAFDHSNESRGGDGWWVDAFIRMFWSFLLITSGNIKQVHLLWMSIKKEVLELWRKRKYNIVMRESRKMKGPRKYTIVYLKSVTLNSKWGQPAGFLGRVLPSHSQLFRVRVRLNQDLIWAKWEWGKKQRLNTHYCETMIAPRELAKN